MTLYQRLARFAARHNLRPPLLKYGFNWSPMYRRTTARLIEVSDDLHRVRIKLPLSWRNKNYVGTIFGGSMAAATDPIFMIQLINILGPEYVVWDKAGSIQFRRPGRGDLTADFVYTEEEVARIKARVREVGEYVFTKQTELTAIRTGEVVARVERTVYVADREHYRAKRERKREGS